MPAIPGLASLAGSLPGSVRVPGRTLTGLGGAERAGARVISKTKSPDAPGDASEPRSKDAGSNPATSTIQSLTSSSNSASSFGWVANGICEPGSSSYVQSGLFFASAAHLSNGAGIPVGHLM